MERMRTEFTRRLLLGALIIGGHFVAVVWHLVLVLKIQPTFPRFAVPLLLLVNLLPVAALVAFAKQNRKLAALLILLPLGVALMIGLYEHFLGPGTDNVLHMPPSELSLPFQVRAVLLVLLEALGCWVGFRIFADARESH